MFTSGSILTDRTVENEYRTVKIYVDQDYLLPQYCENLYSVTYQIQKQALKCKIKKTC